MSKRFTLSEFVRAYAFRIVSHHQRFLYVIVFCMSFTTYCRISSKNRRMKFENEVLKRICGPKERGSDRKIKIITARRFVICYHLIFLGD
jgi:hypothetical protein